LIRIVSVWLVSPATTPVHGNAQENARIVTVQGRLPQGGCRELMRQRDAVMVFVKILVKMKLVD